MYVRKKRIIRSVAVFIAAAMMMTGYAAFPADSSAMSAGDVAKVSFDGYLMGTENKYYTMDLNGSVLFYDKNGNTSVRKVSGKELSKRRHMILTDVSSGETREGYCVEFDAEIKARTSYTGSGYETDKIYFNNLPDDVRKLILAVTYYGRNGSNPLPASGVDGEDYYFATQMLIWEVQQQIRVFERDGEGRITGTKLVSAHGMPADFFYRYIKGRAAEKCYDHIVENIEKHFVTPEYVGETADKAETLLLKYDMSSDSWRGGFEDAAFEMKWNDDTIAYKNNSGDHVFETGEAIEGEKTVKVRRKTDEGSSAEDLLIWNNNTDGDLQVVATGSASPPEFFMKFRTDIPTTVTLSKTDAESGKPIPLAGTEYRIKHIDSGKYVSLLMKTEGGSVYATDKEGTVTVDQRLQAGEYVLEEMKAPKGYVVAKEAQRFELDGTLPEMTIEQENRPQMGVITINKMGEYKFADDWADIRERAMGGIDFDIIALADIVTADGTVHAKKGEVVDTVRTDFNGNVSTKKLYLGPYNVVEKAAPGEYRISEPVNAALVYAGQDVETVEKRINVFNRLKRDAPPDESPKTGDDGAPYTAMMALAISMTLILILVSVSMLRKKES